MRALSVSLLLIAGAFGAAGCGDDDEPSPAPAPQATAQTTPATATETVAREPQRTATTARRRGTRITIGASPFGTMLFDARRQAIYIFERDRQDESVCYGECAEAWPPVYTDGAPVGGEGVRGSLLGTIERRDGRRQVTYAGQPLYFYAHEAPGEVRCHNVNLNGGLWWVIGPDGERRP